MSPLQVIAAHNAQIVALHAAEHLGPDWEAVVASLEASGDITWRYGKLVVTRTGWLHLATQKAGQ